MSNRSLVMTRRVISCNHAAFEDEDGLSQGYASSEPSENGDTKIHPLGYPPLGCREVGDGLSGLYREGVLL